MGKYNIVDLFSGVGGLSYGFAQLPEFSVTMANEVDRDIATAYSLNHPDVTMLNCDIGLVTEDMIKEATGGVHIDVVVGGPPCQSYSTAGKRVMDDRANLFLEYKRVLGIIKPTAFVFENVVGLLSMDKGRLFDRIRDEFSELGYALKYKVLDAVDYGVPQHRKRVILVGFRDNNCFEYPEATHGEGKNPYITVKDALCDLPSLKCGEEGCEYSLWSQNEFQDFVRPDTLTVTEHKAPNNGERLRKIMETLKDGQGIEDLPEELRPKKCFGNSYAKLWWNKPSTTITSNFSHPSSARCIHPRDSRALTIREGARLQSFPDDYKFYGSDGKKHLEIGNAVPPLLSVVIAKQMLVALDAYSSSEMKSE